MQPETTLTVQIVLLGLANPCPEPRFPNWIFPRNYPGTAAPPFKEDKKEQSVVHPIPNTLHALNSSSNLPAKSSEAFQCLPAASLPNWSYGE